MSQPIHEGNPIESLLGRAELATDPHTQADLLVLAASLYETQAEHDRAFFVRCTAYRLLPTASARAELDRLAGLTGRLTELDTLWVETAPTLPPEQRAQAFCDLGRLRLRRLRAPDLALEALEISLAHKPGGEAELLRADALEALDRHAELAEALLAIAETSTSSEEQSRTLVRLADVVERGLGDPARAEEICRQLLALDPAFTPARVRLGHLVRARGDGAALLALLDDQVALAPDDVAALREAATLCETLGRPSDAAERYEQLRACLPGDLAPLRALDRVYAAAGRLRDRAAVLEALCGVVEGERERATLQRELAAAWTELGERSRAIETLEWLLLSDASEETFRALAPLYRAEGRFGALADACTRLLRTAEAPRRLTLQRELAVLFERDLGDNNQAISAWQAVLDSEPDAPDALEALARLYESIDASDRAVEVLEAWAHLAPSGRTRALRLARAAELCASRAELADKPLELLTRALKADPTSVPLRLALAAQHRARGDLHRASELIDAGASDGAPLHVALLAQAALLREASGDLDGALSRARALLERAPDHVEARRHACAVAQRLGRHGEVLELVAQLPDEGLTELRVDRWLLIARSARATGDAARASDAIGRAAALAPVRTDVRQLQAELLLADGRSAEAERVLAEIEAQVIPLCPAARATLAFLGGECARLRGDAEAALVRYRKTLSLDPGHRAALRQRLDLAVELQHWHEALATLETLVTIEQDAQLRARYRHMAGHICHEQLARPTEGLVHYRAALADDAEHPRAAERIEALLREQGDFGGLVTHCAQALERLGEKGALTRRVQLWWALAEAAAGLGDKDGNVAALEVVARLDPGHFDARRRLAALYLEAGPDATDKAIGAHQELLRLDKLHVPAYRALGALYQKTGHKSRAEACLEAARQLAARNAGPSASRASTPHPLLVTRPLSPSDWARLRHPDEDRLLSSLSTLVSPLLAAASATPLERTRDYPGLRVARGAMPPFVQALSYVTRMLDVPMPELFTRDDQMAPLRFVNGRAGAALRPAFVVGLPLLGDRRHTADLVAPLALETVLLRPEHSLRLLVGDAGVLALVLRAVVAVAQDETPAAELAVTAAALKRWLQPLALDQLGVIGRRLRERGRDLVQVSAEWLRAIDLGAARATLVLTGDLGRTLAAVEARAVNPAAAHDAVRELAWASVTDQLWSVRESLVNATSVATQPAHAGG